MLLHPTLEKLSALRLSGMTAALNEQLQMDLADLGFEERLGLLLDREVAVRETRKMKTRLHNARLRQDSCLEAQFSRVDLGKERRIATSPADIPSSITNRAASSRNSFVYRPCGIFSMNDISVLFSYKFSKLWCPFFSTYLKYLPCKGKLPPIALPDKFLGGACFLILTAFYRLFSGQRRSTFMSMTIICRIDSMDGTTNLLNVPLILSHKDSLDWHFRQAALNNWQHNC